MMYAEANDDEIISTAHRICKSLDLGMSGTQVRDTLILNADSSVLQDAGYMTSASIIQYCTKHSGIASQFVTKQ